MHAAASAFCFPSAVAALLLMGQWKSRRRSKTRFARVPDVANSGSQFASPSNAVERGLPGEDEGAISFVLPQLLLLPVPLTTESTCIRSA